MYRNICLCKIIRYIYATVNVWGNQGKSKKGLYIDAMCCAGAMAEPSLIAKHFMNKLNAFSFRPCFFFNFYLITTSQYNITV